GPAPPTTARRPERTADDRDPEPLEPPLHRQAAVDQQDALTLHAVDGYRTAGDVHDREVAAARLVGVHAIPPVRQHGLVALSIGDDRPDAVVVVLARHCAVPACRE